MQLTITVNATTVNKNESKASTTDKKTGVSKITSANDFTWDNANVYFLLTDRFKTVTQVMTTHMVVQQTKMALHYQAGIQLLVHSMVVTLPVLHRKSKMVTLIT